LAAFFRAARRDMGSDGHGNRCLPISMWSEAKLSPQKAQWAFLHAVFPGKVFAADDPLVAGNLAMLRAAEFIRLVRHLLVVERGDGLHLLEGLPRGWLRPGKAVRVRGVLTEFGPLSLELRVAEDVSKAILALDPPQRQEPRRILVHLAGFGGGRETIESPAGTASQREIALRP
jgi:hypothetical protein